MKTHVLLASIAGLLMLIFSSSPLYGQQSVSGVIIDAESEETLPGVNVIVKGTTIGATSNSQGEYNIDVPSLSDTLLFSFVGYQTKEIPIQGRTEINVSLETETISGEELVVVGYGTVRKSDLTGAVSSISSEDLNQGATYSVENALAGKSSGVQVTKTSGAPGAGSVVRIRGTNSISASNEPLYVIDGVPVTSGGLNSINPNDIQSLEVLKDASAASIYGSRGANGVVLITTKQGVENNFSVNFNSYSGVQTLDKNLELTNAREWAILNNEASEYRGQPATLDPNNMGSGTDWTDALYQDVPIHNYQMGVSGGTDNTTYSISGSYFDQGGIVRESNFKRYNLRTNVSSSVSEKLNVGVNLNLSKSINNFINNSANGQSLVQLALTATPNLDIYDENGNFNPWGDPVQRRANPIAIAELDTDKNITNRVIGDINARYDFTDYLSFETKFGLDVNNSKGNHFSPTTSPNALNTGSGSVNTSNSDYWVSNNLLTFDRQLGEDHHVNLLAGFTVEQFNQESIGASSSDFFSDATRFHSLQLSEPSQYSLGTGATEWSMVSWLARARYTLMDKYLLTLNGRVDGSSRFAEDNKYSVFPSGAIAWRISEEPFMESVEQVSEMKLRLSAGITGEQGIGPYQSFASMGLTQYTFGANGPGSLVKGLAVNRFSNPNLKWETTSQYNVGLDIGLFNDRLTLTTDHYYKKTKDLLLQVELPKTSGQSNTLQNTASVKNFGYELGLDARLLTGEFSWSSNVNLSINRNEVLSLKDGVDRIFSQGGISQGDLKSNASALIVGEPIGVIYGYVADGVFKNQAEADALDQPTAAPGELRMKDLNGDGIIDSEDRTIIGNPNPDLTGGMTNTFNYKNFDLSFFTQWSVGNDIYWLGKHYNVDVELYYNKLKSFYENRWTPENRDTDTPRAGFNSRAFTDNSWFIHDGSYFRVKNVTLGYNLPVNFASKLRLYVSADNLLTITSYPGYNPEVSAFGGNPIAQGVDSGTYPNAKTFMLGINLTF